MKKKKKAIIPIIILLLIVVGVVVGVLVVKNKKENDVDGVVYVESVKNITGMGFFGENRYMGIVESQETKGVEKASDKTVKTVFVEVQDTVKEGDPLFEYDTEEMELKLKQLELELTSINNSISTANQQIATLNSEKEQVPAEERIEYTSQIQSLQAQINQYNYDASAKQLEIDRQKASMENATVYSPMDGVIKEIKNESSGSQSTGDMGYYDPNGGDSNSNAFIQIMAMGDYRIKGTANEMNVQSMSVGTPVIVRSRIDETQTWTGTISKIDTEHPDQDNNNYYYSGGTQTTKYPFYVELDSIDGLMLGQHLYIELDYGQSAAREGLWLDEFYIVMDDGTPYVWAADKNDRIEKRKVELGEYDENLMRYEILSGISEEDRIAFPDSYIKEGMKVTENYEDVMDQNMGGDGEMPDGNIDGDMIIPEDGNIDGDMIIPEDGNIDGDMIIPEDGNIDGDMIIPEDGSIDGDMIDGDDSEAIDGDSLDGGGQLQVNPLNPEEEN